MNKYKHRRLSLFRQRREKPVPSNQSLVYNAQLTFLQPAPQLLPLRPSVQTLKPHVFYLYGKMGVGKTMSTQNVLARSGKTYYMKSSGHKWWNDYDKDVVVLEWLSFCFTCSSSLQLYVEGAFSVRSKATCCILICLLLLSVLTWNQLSSMQR